MARTAVCERRTLETLVRVEVDLDGAGVSTTETGSSFLNHMLETLSKHSLMDLKVEVKSLKNPSLHHLVEDVALALGEALDRALGDRRGIRRFGFASIPMDEALVEVSLDASGRPYLHVESLPTMSTEEMSSALIEQFLQSLAQAGRLTVHVPRVYGRSPHHIFEALFKALAVALRQASSLDPRLGDAVPSVKGVL